LVRPFPLTFWLLLEVGVVVVRLLQALVQPEEEVVLVVIELLLVHQAEVHLLKPF
jgi:hypothetical protein